MIDLYIDFDGVILNTIEISLLKLEQLNIKSEDETRRYFENIDWNELLNNSSQINNSINNILMLKESGLFNITILTHVNSNHEITEKIKYLTANLPNVGIIFLSSRYPKYQVVNSENAILVDDFINNISLWEQNGGIGIKFSSSNKEVPYLKINSLDQIMDLYDTIVERIDSNVKKKIRR